MRRDGKLVLAGAAVLAAAAIGGGAGIAAGGDDDGAETPITGTEVGDEESMYEVEVTLEDGSQVDVQLDEDFDVVGSEGDASDEDD